MAEPEVQWENVQGLVLNAYRELRCAAFMLWRLDAREPTLRSRSWLAWLTERTISADYREVRLPSNLNLAEPIWVRSLGMLKALREVGAAEVWAVNIALMPSGLTALGVGARELGRFADEFQKGMTPDPALDGQVARRTSLLGDLGPSSPENWRWGGPQGAPFDGMLLLYATSPASLKKLVEAQTEAMRGAASPVWCETGDDGQPVVGQGRLTPDGMGHFGFRDGISQPLIEGTPRAHRMNGREKGLSVVPAGEFVLGYPDTRGAIASTKDPEDARSRDLVRNGSYLVARQLAQDVLAFDDFVERAANAIHGTASDEEKRHVAARLIGRYGSGEPLIPPSADSPADDPDRNDFLFQAEDPLGIICPLGAHIRRANPRDDFGPDPVTGLRLSKMHRIIRRGRPYGSPLRGPDDPRAREERGLFFICLNASIAGQFELIQHSWINNRHFAHLYDEVDPISHIPAEGSTITLQSRPSNIRLPRPAPFVTVRGGAYFFMPGLDALRSLAQ